MSNRRLRPQVHYLKAEFAGDSGFYCNLQQFYPRAYHTAHLDDGIMETIVTNWGNDGIQIDVNGPSLVGRYRNDIGPAQRIGIGGALYFDANGNLTFDPSSLEGQLAALQAQQLADEATIAALTARVTADEAALAALDARLTDVVHKFQQVMDIAKLQPYGEAQLLGAGSLTGTVVINWLFETAPWSAVGGLIPPFLGIPYPIDPIEWDGFGQMRANMSGPQPGIPLPFNGVGTLYTNPVVTKFFYPAALQGATTLTVNPRMRLVPTFPVYTGVGSLTADTINLLAIRGTTMTGAGSLTANVLAAAFFVFFNGVGNMAVANLRDLMAATVTAFAGGGLASWPTTDPIDQLMRGQATLPGAGSLASPDLQKMLFNTRTYAGAGALTIATLQKALPGPTLAGVGALTADIVKAVTAWAASSSFAGAGSLTGVLKKPQTVTITPENLVNFGKFTGGGTYTPSNNTAVSAAASADRIVVFAFSITANNNLSSANLFGATCTFGGTSCTQIMSSSGSYEGHILFWVSYPTGSSATLTLSIDSGGVDLEIDAYLWSVFGTDYAGNPIRGSAPSGSTTSTGSLDLAAKGGAVMVSGVPYTTLSGSTHCTWSGSGGAPTPTKDQEYAYANIVDLNWASKSWAHATVTTAAASGSFTATWNDIQTGYSSFLHTAGCSFQPGLA